MKNGVYAGFPLVDIKATVVDGSYHDVDSSEMAFKIAGSMALKAAAEKCKPVLLEPIMKVEVTVPEEYMGDVMGDLNSRRGRIEGMDARFGAQIIRARCLCPKCSVTPQLCVPVRKAVAYTRWKSRTMKKYLSRLRKKSSQKKQRCLI